MKLELFKHNDFKTEIYFSDYDLIHIKANKILNSYLQTLPVVYGSESQVDYVWTKQITETDTHQARLICVEEIKPENCEHRGISNNGIHHAEWICSKCGKKLKAKWGVCE